MAAPPRQPGSRRCRRADRRARRRSPRPGDGDVVIPLTGIRKVIADKLSRSRREIPEVTIWVDVDATGLLETRAAINAATPDAPVSILALLARICLSGLRRFPQLNARVDTEGQRIVQSAGVHLGIAAQTDRGLVVPVLRDAQRLTTRELAAELAETTAAARAGTPAAGPADRRHVHPQQLRGVRRRRLHADHQPPGGRAARRRAGSWTSRGWSTGNSPCAR